MFDSAIFFTELSFLTDDLEFAYRMKSQCCYTCSENNECGLTINTAYVLFIFLTAVLQVSTTGATGWIKELVLDTTSR